MMAHCDNAGQLTAFSEVDAGIKTTYMLEQKVAVYTDLDASDHNYGYNYKDVKPDQNSRPALPFADIDPAKINEIEDLARKWQMQDTVNIAERKTEAQAKYAAIMKDLQSPEPPSDPLKLKSNAPKQ